MWASAPTDRRGSYIDHLGQRRRAERLWRGWEERGGIGAEITPKGASNAGQSLSHGEAVTAPVVPKAWPPPTKRRWRLGRRSRCPKFFARMRSQNFDRCHSFLLASSVTGGARKRPSFHKGALGTGDADCHVGPVGLLAMTTVSCHSEERSDVGIRPFYDGRGFGPPYLGHGLRRPNFVPKFGASVKSSCPTADSSCCGAQNSLLADCSQNFDRCHSFLLASSATGGARKRPPFHKGALRDGSTAGGAPSTDRNIARRFYEKESKSLTLRHGPRDLG